MADQKVYVVTAYRWADRERHSYLIGVYPKKHQALQAADIEEAHRGGNKYCCEVLQCVIGDGIEGREEPKMKFKAIKQLPAKPWL